MDDISSVAVLPDRIRELENAREWTEAAQVLLEGCRALARDELRGVGGLANVRKEMARRRLSLQQLLIEAWPHSPSTPPLGPFSSCADPWTPLPLFLSPPSRPPPF